MGSRGGAERLELLDAEGRQLAGSGVRESRVVKGDLNPRWDQEIVFGGECPVCDAAGVQLTVLDKDFRADDIIGEIEIPIDPGAHRHKRRRPPGHGSMNVVSEAAVVIDLHAEQAGASPDFELQVETLIDMITAGLMAPMSAATEQAVKRRRKA